MNLPVYKNKIIYCYTIVDDDLFEELNKYKWSISSRGYVHRHALKDDEEKFKEQHVKKWSSKILLHRYVNKTPYGYDTDHINQNKLDNRKENLRTCTKTQNEGNRDLTKANKSGYKGVHWHRAINKWRASIKKNRRWIHLGDYDTKIAAALAYNCAAKILHGEFAVLNNVDSRLIVEAMK